MISRFLMISRDNFLFFFEIALLFYKPYFAFMSNEWG